MGDVVVCLLLHVDFVVASNRLDVLLDVRESFMKKFEMRDLGTLSYFWELKFRDMKTLCF